MATREEFMRDAAEVLRSAVTPDVRADVIKAYDDAIIGAANPMLYEDGDGPLDLQRKIRQALEFRKKLALSALANQNAPTEVSPSALTVEINSDLAARVESLEAVLASVVSEWDIFERGQLQLDEGVEQAIEAARIALQQYPPQGETK